MTARPLAWVASIIYVAVLVAGGYFHLAGLVPASPGRTAGFFALLLTLLGLETAEWLRYRGGTPRPVAIGLLAVRSLLYAAVSTLDPSGFARALFLLIPFAAYFTLGRRASAGIAAALLGLLVLRLPAGWYRDQETLSDLLMFVIGLVFAVSMAAVAARAQAYAGQVERLATVAERNRLARDLHDSLGHHLTAASVQLEKAEAYLHRDEAVSAQAMSDARASVRYALADVRHSVGSLRGGVFSLRAALAELVRSDPSVGLRIDGDEHGYSSASLLALYRVAQEALTNARRHAAASRVTMTLELGRVAGRLEVNDDGRGFEPDGVSGGYGLRGMVERLALVGGGAEVSSRPGAGTTVVATVPSSMVEAMA